MNAVGIDVSKGKSMVCVMRPFGEVVLEPFEVLHTAQSLNDLAGKLKALDGETRVVMEATGNYHKPVAFVLHDAGLFVSVVNPVLIHDYDNNSLRRVKTDRKDAVKIANYTLDKWTRLRQYLPEDDTRLALKNCYRQYQQAVAVRTMLKNNLISSLDLTFPDANKLFSSPAKSNGCEKWVDFIGDFWHSECVSSLSSDAFAKKYLKWCQKHGYNFTRSKSDTIYACAVNAASLPKSPTSKLLIQQQVAQLKAVSQSVAAFQQEMLRLSQQLPEFDTVMEMYGVGPSLGPQLMAEIGDVRRFSSKKSLIAFAGIEPQPNDSGKIVGNDSGISKVGSAVLRRTLFLIMTVILKTQPQDEPVFQFMNKKRSEGKPYKVYMMASANKFLRIYYARVKAVMDSKHSK
ncbi:MULTISPECIES: IS110 family RNA-guided transposase [Bacillota]|jgi:transposase|uniref:IS110 family transposase n=1 Tax=Faecalibacterium prausnitzii TaxID=853 RepID=A0A6A8KK56_9FIRM|nr:MULTISPECIES: IS110 family transposase [Bacillota]NCC05400.1 IS110 family transposase [Pseudomonadota bacterium]MBS6773458.1 IS110 family transposase [Faecalibacterium prausnitzii]MSC22411.1 IS110 family transposase [Lacticaseibacillus rhamnosus]MSC47334.1 IS110 family transposase [Faecalibacterium prausnitzii]MSC50299.1 IS110 family transposase [Faecalibacterium prausnitzii]